MKHCMLIWPVLKPRSFNASYLARSCTGPPGWDISPSEIPSNNAGAHLQLRIPRHFGVN